MIDFIDENKAEYGVEPICTEFADRPQTYYAARNRALSKRSVSDAATTEKIRVVHEQNYGVYGVRKVHAQLNRDGVQVFKADLVHNRGPWSGIKDLAIAVAEYIDWFNHRRLQGELGHRPPIEIETEFYANQPVLATAKRD